MKKKVMWVAVLLFVFGGFFSQCVKKETAPIKIAILGPFDHIPGKGIRTGADLAVEEINKNGGIVLPMDGKEVNHPIELIYVDDKFIDTAFASIELRKAIDEKGSRFIVGGYASKVVVPLMDVMAAKKILWLGTGGSTPTVVDKIESDHHKYRYYFRTGTISADMAADSIAEFTEKSLMGKGIKKVAFVCVNHSFARYFIIQAQKKMQSLGFEVVLEQQVPIDIKDFTPFFNKVKTVKADLIVVAFLADESNVFIKQAAQLGITNQMPIIGILAPANDPTFYKSVGSAAQWLTHIVLFSPVIDQTGKVTTDDFFKKYRKKFNELPFWTASATYDSLYLLKHAIETTGSLETEKIIRLLESDDFEYVGFRRLKWRKKNHDLYTGKNKGKDYLIMLWEQFFPDGKSYYVFPTGYHQKEFHIAGQQ